MQRCPTCNRTYPDDAPAFCPHDAARLVSEVPGNNPQPPPQGAPYGNAPQQYAPQQQPQQYAPPPYAAPQQWGQPPVGGGINPKVIIGSLIGLLLLAGIGIGIYFLTKGSDSSSTSSGSTSAGSSPTATAKAFNEAARRKDIAGLKSLMSKSTLDKMDQAAKAQNKTIDDLLKASNDAEPPPATLETRNEKIDGETATLEVNLDGKGRWQTVNFVKEDGQWKFDH